MSHQHEPHEMQRVIQENLIKGSKLFSGPFLGLLGVLLVVGLLTAAAGCFAGECQRLWTAFHVNTLFWTGLSFFGVLFSVILQLTRGVWGRPMKRFAEALAGFLPFSFLFFGIEMLLGGKHIFPWLTTPPGRLESWFSFNRLFTMNMGLLGFLYLLGFIFLYYSARTDIGVARDKYFYYTKDLARWLIGGWKGASIEVPRAQKILDIVAVPLALGYGLIFSLLAFDMIMSLDPHWYSTLFGGYFFITNVYLGWAVVTFVNMIANQKFKLDAVLAESGFHDGGKLTFAFALASAYFFWAQYKIIWFANLPEEIPFVFIRFHAEPWRYMSLVAIALVFVIPFLTLVRRDSKTNLVVFGLVTTSIFCGLILERFIQVYPSIYHTEMTLGLWELGITAGFFGLFWLCYYAFVSQFPIFSVGDPMFDERLRRISQHV